MPATEEVYRFIHREAPSFAESVRAAAAASHNEAELRTHVAHHIRQLADQLGVRLHLREEYTLAEGQADGAMVLGGVGWPAVALGGLQSACSQQQYFRRTDAD